MLLSILFAEVCSVLSLDFSFGSWRSFGIDPSAQGLSFNQERLSGTRSLAAHVPAMLRSRYVVVFENGGRTRSRILLVM